MSKNLKEIRAFCVVESVKFPFTKTDAIDAIKESAKATLDLVEEQISERIKELEAEKKLCITPERKEWKQVAIDELNRFLGKVLCGEATLSTGICIDCSQDGWHLHCQECGCILEAEDEDEDEDRKTAFCPECYEEFQKRNTLEGDKECVEKKK